MSKPNILDLYSGCGGFALGAELTGFKIIDSVEIDPNLHYSFKLNFPQTKTHLKDIKKIDRRYWKNNLCESRPDGIIGGPPCQGFSFMGKRSKTDPRNDLVDDFYRHVEALKPKFFVMENVTGILSGDAYHVLDRGLNRVCRSYEICDPIILRADKFGVPTKRNRVFIIGYRKDSMNPISTDKLQKKSLKPVVVKDALHGLPKVVQRESRPIDFEWGSYRENLQHGESQYATKMKSLPPKHLGWFFSKEALKSNKVSGNNATVHSDSVKARFRSTRQGETEKISRYPRLSLDGYCPTLRAGTGSDRGSFQAMRPIHPTQPRVISVREAARLQSFPDWFVFHPTIWHSFRMIGNSVPPLLAKSILNHIKTSL